jgi:tRNA (guanine-N7-)-methyltransferase
MRVRNRKGAPEMMAANTQYVVENPEAFKGKWAEKFGNNHPIHIEVGSGKGHLLQVWQNVIQTLTISPLICN